MALFNRKSKAAKEPEVLPISEPVEEEKKSKPAPNRERSEVLWLRLTPEEKEELQQLADQAGMNRTDFIMASVRREPIVVFPAAREILSELRKQGTNLNQMAKVANTKGQIDTQHELEELIAESTLLREKLVQACDQWEAVIIREKGVKPRGNCKDGSKQSDAG